MSGFSDSIVDAEGNIRTDSLSKELRAALQEDVRYRQTDNMKKRAVKVAGDYSVFKNMVAAAHLKKLTQKEVESLSHVKKGWHKAVAKDTSSSAQILTKEYEMDQLLAQNSSVGKLMDGRVKPKTCMEVERDLRRMPSEEEKLRYVTRPTPFPHYSSTTDSFESPH
jgi:hydrogenase maturation factor